MVLFPVLRQLRHENFSLNCHWTASIPLIFSIWHFRCFSLFLDSLSVTLSYCSPECFYRRHSQDRPAVTWNTSSLCCHLTLTEYILHFLEAGSLQNHPASVWKGILGYGRVCGVWLRQECVVGMNCVSDADFFNLSILRIKNIFINFAYMLAQPLIISRLVVPMNL